MRTVAQKARRNELARAARAANPERVRAYFRGYHDPEATRERKLRERYGIGLVELRAMIAEQGGTCALCAEQLADGMGRKVHVDHDHATGRIRGILCAGCNTAIGKLGDNEAGLQRALNYVRGNR